MLSDNTPAPPEPRSYRPNEIVLYGVKLNDERGFADTPFDPAVVVDRTGLVLRMQVHKTDDPFDARPVGGDRVSIIVGYGYAFDGSCYRFDRPRLLLVAASIAGAAAEGCGFDEPYMMWRITTKTILLDVSTATGPAEELILAAHLPGNRPPNTYGNHLVVAHRGGRLDRGGGQ